MNRNRYGLLKVMVSYGTLILSLIGCNSEEHDLVPPDHITKLPMSQGKYLFGVSDTIPITFSEAIDTAALLVEFSPPEGIAYRFDGSSRLLIFGKNQGYGVSYFNINSPFSSLITGLRDMHGNGHLQIRETFRPYLWLDQDFVDPTFSGFDSLIATDTTWKDGSLITDSLVMEGSLDSKVNIGPEDRQDFKILPLVPPDSLSLVLTCSKALNIKIEIAGPFSPIGIEKTVKTYNTDSSFFTSQTHSSGRIFTQFNAKYEAHHKVLGAPSLPGIYIIRLSIPLDVEGFYRLGLKVRKFKR